MEKVKNRRLVVVLGAARSGLSAVTKVLESLGVHFGPGLVSAPTDGSRRSPEDQEREINDSLLTHLGSGCDRLTSVTSDVPLDSTILHLRTKAFQLISNRLTKDDGIWGLKDPRTCRLLDFWNKVFSALDGQVSFVLTVRNPASVAASLAAKDAIPAEKGYFLWLQHVLPSVLLTGGAQRLVVDYDELLGNPRHQIARISARLGLSPEDAGGATARDLEATFLKRGRRRAQFTPADLAAEGRASSIVAPTYLLLNRLATDQESLDSPGVQAAFEEWNAQLTMAAPAFGYINSLEDARSHLLRLGAEHEAQAAHTRHTLAVRTQALTERDAHIAERDAHIAKRDAHIAELTAALSNVTAALAATYSSNSWRVTKPLRSLSLLARGDAGTPMLLPSKPYGPAPESKPAGLPPEPAPLSALDQVPPGFDPQLYLDLHPDLDGSFEWAASHYLRHGQYEGRGFTLPEIDLLAEDGFRSGRETILVVSHEASRTGAPVLSLNLVQASMERYNVVALILGGGTLCDAFRKAGAAVVMSPRLRGNPVLTEVLIRRLHERFHFRFALVNSIESRLVLPALGKHFIPAVTLLHEFAAYTRPATAFRDAFFWSSEVVFSTNVTLENAHAEHPDLRDRNVHVLPQGRCIVPSEGLTDEQLQADQRRIRRLMRPAGAEDKAVVVLGAGTVQMRKGVDLFIQCAARARLVAPEVEYRFVWMGAGYDPEGDAAYSAYLADQIRRAGLERHIVFIDESVAIETAYEEADLFLLSSRLDPLPNVAIEAMAFGLPLLCFNKTTGIADFLIDAGLAEHCVAEYLDASDLAGKLSALAGSRVLRERVGGQCREASASFFSAKKYFAGLHALAESACQRVRQEKEDTRLILASGVFRPDFSIPPQLSGQSLEHCLRVNVRAWASGIGRRKPFPGFHPGIYLEQHGVAIEGADPVAEYLRAGRPEGPWNYPVIVEGEDRERALPRDGNVALHLHVHYPELLPEMIARLSRNRIRPDLLVSVNSEKVQQLAVGQLEDYNGKVVAVELVPNRGRDIGPLLTAFGQRILADYEYVGHVHTKKTADLKDGAVGKTWYKFLLENLLGGESGAMADSIIGAMSDDASIGMVFPDDPNVIGWTANRPFAETLASRLGLEALPEHWNFPMGTMFWARTAALAPWIKLNLDWDDYPAEPLPYDGTLLHAIERLFPLTLSLGKLRTATTNVVGLTR
jgi:glycosyltransferase involved in cell wall biosynthesis